MDVFAHALWTNVVYFKKYKNDLKDRLWAVFFGVAPDLVSFTPAIIYAFLFSAGGNQLMRLASSDMWVFVWARTSYQYTHSLVIFLGATLIVTALRKGKIYWPMLGWLLHILIDIPTHHDFYETPFLYPLSNYHFHYGISWAEIHFMIVNYSLLAIFYILIFTVWKNKTNG